MTDLRKPEPLKEILIRNFLIIYCILFILGIIIFIWLCFIAIPPTYGYLSNIMGLL